MSTLEHEVEDAKVEQTANPLPSPYGYLWDGKQWYRTSRKFGDIGRETNGMPYSKSGEKFIDNRSVRKRKYRNAA